MAAMAKSFRMGVLYGVGRLVGTVPARHRDMRPASATVRVFRCVCRFASRLTADSDSPEHLFAGCKLDHADRP